MSFSVRALTRRALVAASAGVLVLSTTPAAAAGSLDEFTERLSGSWGPAATVESLSEVYAPDGVHTATFYDRTNEYTGPEEIISVARFGTTPPELIGPRIDLPAPDGEYRWVSFASLAGGTPCLWHAVDGLVVRQDCVLPENSVDSRPKAGLADAEATAAIDEVMARLDGKWGPDATVEGLAEVYAPDAVHTARFLHRNTSYTGPEEIIRVARGNVTNRPVGPRVDFDAPAGELAWAGVSSLSGGSVCLYRAVEGMITRHDCFVPYAG